MEKLDVDSSTQKDDASFERWKACADRISLEVDQSATDLTAKIERPQNMRQLLEHLKRAGEQNWLMRPSFYNEAVLLKFFNGSKVIWNKPDSYRIHNTQYVVASIASEALPKMLIEVENNCSVYGHKADSGPANEAVTSNGFINLELGSTSGLGLEDVRDVFGQGDVRSIDRGISPHGVTYTPTYRGSVRYASTHRGRTDTSQIETVFYLGEDLPPGYGADPSAEIVDDRVTRISMHDMQERAVRNP